MQEYTRIRQEDNGFRRLFFDEMFDLYVWYSYFQGPIIGFQLVYTHDDMQKALTWTEKEGYSHTGIDEGDRKLINQSPMLIQDGVFQYEFVYAELVQRMHNLEPDIRDLVVEKIEAYQKEEGALPL